MLSYLSKKTKATIQVIMKPLLFIALISTLFVLSVHGQQFNKVIIFGLDGVRPDALKAANTPIMDALAANGTYSWDALNEGTTSSGPGWSNILTGVWQNKHGVSDNSFSGSNYSDYPSLFKYIEDHNRQLYTVSICEWHPINNSIIRNEADDVINTSGPSDTESKVISYLKFQNPDALFVHLDSPDGAGHGYGFSSDVPQYISTLEAVDTSMGKMLEALEGRPNHDKENWLVIVTTDHGGLGTSHGGNSIEEKNIFLIVSGDKVAREELAKTIEGETTIEPVANCLGDAVELYFDGNDDHVQVPLDPKLDFGTDQDFSVEVKIRTSIAADVSIVGNKDWVTGRNKGFVFSFSGGTWKVNVGDGNSNTRVDVNGSNVSDNEWHMLSATFDRDGDLKIYEDGTMVGSKSLAGIGDITTGLPFSIGADGLKAYEYTGHIAEVRVYKALLDAGDIDTWQCKKLDNTYNKYDQLIGYWRLVDGQGTTVTDLSPSNLDGSLTGAEWEDATDSETVITYDYSATPRQVDVVPTALEHLCIPIDDAWKLDGQVIGATCQEPDPIPTAIGTETAHLILIYPNPSPKGNDLKLKYSGVHSGKMVNLKIHDQSGKLVFLKNQKLSKAFSIDTGFLPNGIYNMSLEFEQGSLETSQFVIK